MRARQPSTVHRAIPRPRLLSVRLPTSTTSIRLESSSSAPSSSSSSSSTSTWEPVLAPSTSAAYDTSLAYLQSDQTRLLSRLDRLRTALSSISPSHPSYSQLLARISTLETQAYINDPSIRHAFAHTQGKGKMDQPVMRHLASNKWKKEGGLDVVMGRLFQNKLIPDLLPDIPPTEPLTVRPRSMEMEIEPAIRLPPSAFDKPPVLHFQPFDHPSTPTTQNPNPTVLYTLLVVDPDSPDPDAQKFSERLHYMKVDIPLGVTTGQEDLFGEGLGKEVLSWEPPAPENGTPIHRYTFLLVRQSTSSPEVQATAPSRESFSVRKYLSAQSIPLTNIAGISLFRSQWSREESEYIDGVWREYRGRDSAPVYGRPPKEVRYGYPQKGVERRAEEVRRQAWEKAVEEMVQSQGGEVVIEA